MSIPWIKEQSLSPLPDLDLVPTPAEQWSRLPKQWTIPVCLSSAENADFIMERGDNLIDGIWVADVIVGGVSIYDDFYSIVPADSRSLGFGKQVRGAMLARLRETDYYRDNDIPAIYL